MLVVEMLIHFLPFLRKLARKKLEDVAMDMSSACYQAVHEALPHVYSVFDRYHIMAIMNQAIETLRRDQQKEFDDLGKETLKGNRFLLLRNHEDLKTDRKAHCDALLEVDQPLFIIHSMKEQLRFLWDKENWNAAKAFLDHGVRMPSNPA